jgi:hypothetical protein
LAIIIDLKEAGLTRRNLGVFFSFSSRSNNGMNDVPTVKEISKTRGV